MINKASTTHPGRRIKPSIHHEKQHDIVLKHRPQLKQQCPYRKRLITFSCVHANANQSGATIVIDNGISRMKTKTARILSQTNLHLILQFRLY